MCSSRVHSKSWLLETNENTILRIAEPLDHLFVEEIARLKGHFPFVPARNLTLFNHRTRYQRLSFLVLIPGKLRPFIQRSLILKIRALTVVVIAVTIPSCLLLHRYSLLSPLSLRTLSYWPVACPLKSNRRERTRVKRIHIVARLRNSTDGEVRLVYQSLNDPFEKCTVFIIVRSTTDGHKKIKNVVLKWWNGHNRWCIFLSSIVLIKNQKHAMIFVKIIILINERKYINDYARSIIGNDGFRFFVSLGERVYYLWTVLVCGRNKRNGILWRPLSIECWWFTVVCSHRLAESSFDWIFVEHDTNWNKDASSSVDQLKSGWIIRSWSNYII